MPDPTRILTALAVAAVVAAFVLVVCRRPGLPLDERWVTAGLVLGPAIGFYAGCGLLGIWPRWPATEDQDRLLAVVMPSIVVTELVALWPVAPRTLITVLRLAVAGGTARVLLAGTLYLSQGDPRGWSTGQIWLRFGSLGLVLGIVWWAFARLGRRVPDVSVPAALAVALVGAGVAVMLSGYSSGGQVSLPFAAALVAASLAATAVAKPLQFAGPVGVGSVLLFSVLMMGHFFGELTVTHAALLALAPLAAWLVEAPLLDSRSAAVRGGLRVLLVSAIVAVVLANAGRSFVFQPPAQRNEDAGADDYLNFDG